MTTAEKVTSYLQSDPPLTDTLTRSVANLRRTARWLIEDQGWEATEDAVVSALRRYAERNPTPPYTRDRELLSKCSVDVETGYSYATLAKSPELSFQLSQTASHIDEFERLYVLEGEGEIRIVTDESNLESLKDEVSDLTPEDILSPVTIVKLILPPEREAIALAGHAIGGLVHQGLHVLDVATCSPQSSLIVPAAETLDAFETVSMLTQAR